MGISVLGKRWIEVIRKFEIAVQILENAPVTTIIIIDYAKMLPRSLNAAGL